MKLRQQLGRQILYFDGGSGTMLQKMGLAPGEAPEMWNLSHGECIRALHAQYLAAGADFITTNTFGANALKFDNVEEMILAALSHAKAARDAHGGDKTRYIAFDMGPLGRLLRPLGDLDFEEAVALFACNVRAAVQGGADVILVETMNDLYEAKAAVLAARENSTLPVFLTTVFDESARLMTGASPEAVVAMAEGLGVDAVGVNCSLGPAQMLQSVVPRLVACAHVPVIVNPNAGLPHAGSDGAVFDVDAESFSDEMVRIAACGATILGGCCGTTPEYIEKTVRKTASMHPCAPRNAHVPVVCSYTHAVTIGRDGALIGERINPTGKPKLKNALRSGDLSYILAEAVRQQARGAHILDVNAGLPDIDESQVLPQVVCAVQGVCDLPLQIDTSNPEALARAMRCYNGKPLVNSVNARPESMQAVFPLVKRYGGVVVALTLDENGIPDTPQGRLDIARRIVLEAQRYGIGACDIVVDPLAMAVSADEKSARCTLESIALIRGELGVATILGVSNISFGLPQRPTVNAAFFAMALSQGLDCAILNPDSDQMLGTYYAVRMLQGMDEKCGAYVRFASAQQADKVQETAAQMSLKDAIVNGMSDAAAQQARTLLQSEAPLALIDTHIVPALDEVGRGFEEKRVFLPQLLMSAEAANAAFEVVRGAFSKGSGARGKVVIATVRGDIHDIGKNIVRVLLQNYGFEVIDLGRDVPAQTIVEAVEKSGARLVGLSALMTTTVPAMQETIALLHERDAGVRIVVGGAVLTQAYADSIGADYYAADAMQTVRYAQRVLEENAL